MNDKEREIYYKRCSRIRYWLLRAYKNYGILNAMSNHNDAVAAGVYERCPNMIYKHICELTKTDLALCIWKIYIDNHPNANTIYRLNDFLHVKGYTYSAKLGLSTAVAPVKKQIYDARHKFLAHDDITRDHVEANMELAKKALDEIVVMYNGLCDKSIDDRVEQISKEDIGEMTFVSTFQMMSVMQSSSTEKE